MLLFVASEAEYQARALGASPFVGGITGGMVGGLAQAYATMGFCTCMKTVEITKHKVAASGMKPPGTLETFMNIYRAEGIRGINKGVNAVAVRQVTNWGSRFGLSRVAENLIKSASGKGENDKLGVGEKILASGLGGGLSAWNQPIEVIRVEMQSKTEDPNRPKKLGVVSAAKYIYGNNGIKGLYRGVTPRIALGVWQTVCMVALGDVAKDMIEKATGEAVTAKYVFTSDMSFDVESFANHLCLQALNHSEREADWERGTRQTDAVRRRYHRGQQLTRSWTTKHDPTGCHVFIGGGWFSERGFQRFLFLRRHNLACAPGLGGCIAYWVERTRSTWIDPTTGL